MTDTSARIGFDYLTGGQGSPEATVNAALAAIDLRCPLLWSERSVAFDEFYGGTIANSSPFGFNSNGTGAAATTATRASDSSHPGVVTLSMGTTTTGYSYVATKNLSSVLFGGGQWTFEACVNLQALSDGTNTYTMRAGFGDSVAGTEHTDGAFFRYTHGTNSGKWQCVTRSNGTETATDSGISAAATTWVRLTVVVAAAATSVQFYVNGTLVVTSTLNIPSGTGRETGMVVGPVKSAGTTNVDVDLDYVGVELLLTTPR